MEERQFENFQIQELLSEEVLLEYKKHGFSIVGFTYNPDTHCYVYLFEKSANQFFDYENANIPQKDFSPSQQSSRFMFKNALIGLGVKPQTADDWIKVRKAKRAAQTETAFKTVATQMKMVMDEYGVSADDVVRIAVERNWQGLMARFFENIEWKDYGIKVGQQDLPFDKEGGWQ